ncbi:MAG TPA: hypothetical protein VJV04_03515 [Nitrospiraceae bacterium]|nr:hypothetical protein [Nitrospiraceae bacterium]
MHGKNLGPHRHGRIYRLFEHRRLSFLFDTARSTIYYSVITEKELLSKLRLREAERQEITSLPIGQTDRKPLRFDIPGSGTATHGWKEADALVASGLVNDCPCILATQNIFGTLPI